MSKIKSAVVSAALLLAATAGALAQSAPANLPGRSIYGRLGVPGDTGPGSAIPIATLGAQLGISGIPGVSIESQHGGCGVADNTTALLAAVNSVAGPVRVLFPNSCTYNFRQTNAIRLSKAGVYLEGTGERATTLQYYPTGNGSFLQWDNGVRVMFNGGIRNLALLSTDTTFSKVMVNWYDVSGFIVSDILCSGGSVAAGLSQLTGGGSSCLYSHGRDGTTISKVQASAQIPIHIGMNPHWYGSADHYHFSDLTLIGDFVTGQPIIKVDPGVVFTNTTFDGAQEWVGGFAGFDYADTAAAHFVSAVTSPGSGYTAGVPVALAGGTCSTPITVTPLTVTGSGGILTASIADPGICSVTPSNPASLTTGGAAVNTSLVAGYRLSFSNVRSEQGQSGSLYTFNIQPKGQLQGLIINNTVMDGVRCGAFLKNTFFATIQQSSYGAGGCGVVVNATAANSNDMLHYIDDFWGPGTTHVVTGLTPIRFDASPTATSVGVPPSALYSSTIGGSTFNSLGISVSEVFSGSSSGTTTVQAAAAASGVLTLPAATDTLVGKSTTDTLANKTLTTPVINGTSTGTGVTTTNTANTIVQRDGSGNFSAGAITGNLSGTATIASNVAITNDTATNATMCLLWVTTSTGNLPLKVSCSKATINPSTGIVSAIGFAGDATGLSGTAASLTAGTFSTGSAANLNAGALLAARMPALTGDCTTSAGAVATTCTKINGVDQTTAWPAYSPVLSCAEGAGHTPGAGNTLVGASKSIGKTVHFRGTLTVGAAGVGTCTQFAISLPATAQGNAEIIFRDYTTGLGGMGDIAASGTTASLNTAAGASIAGNSKTVVFNGTYESQ